MLFFSIALFIAALYQVLIYLVNKHMVLGHSLPLLGNFIKLTFVRYTGAAFSLFVGFSPYLTIIGLLIAAAVIYWHYRIPADDHFAQAALAFVLGGSLGNLLDRLLRSYVIDYIDLSIWPVFNLADILINVGVMLLAVKLLTKDSKDVSDPV